MADEPPAAPEEPSDAPPPPDPAASRTTGGANAGTRAGRDLPASPGAPLGPGRTLGRFRIDAVLGHGGMGTVYRAFDDVLQRHVALKVPRFDAAGDPALLDEFLKEARAAAAVSHPHLVEVHDAGVIGDRGYLAAALCTGPDLAAWLAEREEPVPPALAAALLVPLAEAAHCCHLAGVVHRDLKPANVLLDAPDPAVPDPSVADDPALPGDPGRGEELRFVPKISDFGVARVLEESVSATRTSRAVGTPLYMAPEQADNRPDEIGPRTDVWALGAMLYELLTGRPPFERPTTTGLLRAIAEEEPPPPRRLRPGTPAGLESICLKCLRKAPGDRYADAAALAADLTAWREGRAISARRFGWRDRFATWSRRPQRVRDAGVVAVVWNGALAAGIGLLAFEAGMGWNTPLPPDDAFLGETLTTSLSHAAIAVIAGRILSGDRRAYWFCFAVAALAWFVTLHGLFWGGETFFTIYRELPEAKYLVLAPLTAAFTTQLAMFALSVRARAVR